MGKQDQVIVVLHSPGRKRKNHTIGIVLCKRKNSALVEITLPEDANIHAREYQLYLPSKEELQQKLVEWLGEQDGQDD